MDVDVELHTASPPMELDVDLPESPLHGGEPSQPFQIVQVPIAPGHGDADDGGDDADTQARTLLPCALAVSGMQHIIHIVCQDMHTVMSGWAQLYEQLHKLHAFLSTKERVDRFLWTCVRNSPLEHRSTEVRGLSRKLYEKMWHVVVSFLKKLMPGFNLLAVAWDSVKYRRGVDKDGKSKPRADADEGGAAFPKRL